MDTFYELIDLTSGNVVGDYDTETEALAEVRRFADRYGIASVRDYSLMLIHDGRQTLVAMQESLVRLATNGVDHGGRAVSAVVAPASRSGS